MGYGIDGRSPLSAQEKASRAGVLPATRSLDLRRDPANPESPVIASEFCGTSITSESWSQQRIEEIRRKNAHAKYANAERRGYIVMDISKSQCQVALRGIDDEKQRDTGIATQARFVVADGRPGPQRV